MSVVISPKSMWHYQDGAQAIGPVSAEVVVEKIKQGTIRRGTLVWTDGMANWTAVENTHFGNETESALNNPYAATSTAVFSPAAAITGPVSDAPAWAIATAPLWLALLTWIPGTSLIGVGVYVGLSIWDRDAIKKTGHTPSNGFWWAILLGAVGAPIYLYLRARRLDGKMNYFVTSLASLVAYIAIIVVITLMLAKA
ncbi:DUF4339 domain-containing protein [Dyella tabacisoli]|uniref:DUF4339 domain-containing protein n=1 Tax=Dyella tabacisoli TaxID=2282381 RepID=A0A369USC1_9GAMM|nr:DUF4339 domain-containing protein [Dyella tabacisoli]RDD83652.1 DUF4339 domain-containing protein [Dyella tabacisoli]